MRSFFVNNNIFKEFKFIKNSFTVTQLSRIFQQVKCINGFVLFQLKLLRNVNKMTLNHFFQLKIDYQGTNFLRR